MLSAGHAFDTVFGEYRCPTCGQVLKVRPQIDSVKRQLAQGQAREVWETCEISYEEVMQPERRGWRSLFQKHCFQFVACAYGPQGRYIAGQTEGCFTRLLYPDVDATTLAQVRGLVNRLVQEGWEDLGNQDTYWYHHRFRRRAKSLPSSHPRMLARIHD